jgi:hypothetical protein
VRIGRWAGVLAVATVLGSGGLSGAAGASHPATFLGRLTTIGQVGSTVPANGDVNPYGVAVVPSTAGKLVTGDVLVSNFNNKANVQGTGTTIVEVAPSGTQQLFAQISQLPAGMSCPGGIGLSTALDILPGGWVVVGSLPSEEHGALPSVDPAGCLIVLSSAGSVVETITNDNIVGPWDMTAQQTQSGVNLFVSNALGGNTKTDKGVPVTGDCTIVRVGLMLSSAAPPQLLGTTVIGQGYPWKANAAAFVLAPTGLALSKSTLFVDNSLHNTVSAIPNAATRTSAVTEKSAVTSMGGSLNAPLGMVAAPNGDVLVVNGNNGVATELNAKGKQVGTKTLVKHGAGDLFGLAITPSGKGFYFVNDGTNALDVAQQR